MPLRGDATTTKRHADLPRHALLTLLCLIAPCLVPASAEENNAAAGAWREIFKREAEPPSPPDNPLTPKKVALGARLFFDRRLSSGSRACASCHRPERAFGDRRPRAIGLSGQPLPRNTPSLFNLAWSKQYFWDGRAPSLEAQVAMPIEAGEEMNGHWPTILRSLGRDADLVTQFQAAFPEERSPSRSAIVKALASYVRSLVSPATRFDAWIAGDARALRAAEIRGFQLFVGRGACVLCHVGWRFTDDRFHDIGLRSKDAGRGALLPGAQGLIAFKTPGLRELSRTAPYMHDGSLATLAAVLNHYNGRWVERPSLAQQLNRNPRFTARERADMIAFLRSLSSGAPGDAR
jgi:cytochrome c peroxidase